MLADLRFAVRMLAKSPGFTAIAVFTLALGIGSATTAFTAVNGLLLRPLPFIQEQERMLALSQSVPARGADTNDISLADFLYWREHTQTLSALWLYEDRTAIITGRTQPVRKLAGSLSAGAFRAMGVQPMLGRDFTPEDDRPGARPVVILGWETWQKDFGGSEDVLGQTIKINGEDTAVIGVMPRGWRYPDRHDLWMPLQPGPTLALHGYFRYRGHAMLAPGVTLEQARAEFATFSADLARKSPLTNEGVTAVLQPIREEATQDAMHLAFLLFGAVMFVFLIACANVTNLLLARGSVRAREIAIRLALGASRLQIVRQLLTESLLLSALGSVGGLIVALWGVDLMLNTFPMRLPFWLAFDLDLRVFGFVALLALLASVLFGLVPALQTSRPELVEEIKDGSRSAGVGARTHRLRQLLVVAEIALALVLLVGAGLMMRSFMELNRASPGFDPRQVLTFRLGFPTSVTEDKKAISAFFRDLTPRLAALPGVERAAAISWLPGLGGGGFAVVVREGETEPASVAHAMSAVHRIATPDYFETLRIPRIAGRTFTVDDDATRPLVTVVDEQFARTFYPGTDPIGKRLRTMGKPGEKPEWLEIVGVVGTTRRLYDRDESHGTFYVPHAQSPANFMSIALRVQGDPASYIDAARAEVLAVNRDMPIYYELPLTTAIEHTHAVGIRRFFGRLFVVFAAVALLLASVGIYGVMAYAVAQRTQEIGVRMALGAQPRDVMRMVIRQGIRLVGYGLAAGFVAAFFTAELLSGNLYGISPRDPPTFALVPALLAAVALLACWLPTRRATSIDPNTALRAE